MKKKTAKISLNIPLDLLSRIEEKRVVTGYSKTGQIIKMLEQSCEEDVSLHEIECMVEDHNNAIKELVCLKERIVKRSTVDHQNKIARVRQYPYLFKNYDNNGWRMGPSGKLVQEQLNMDWVEIKSLMDEIETELV
jgi:hypothetical protein